MKPFRFAGINAAVTGGGGGIGRALCKALAREGVASVLSLDRDIAGARETVRQCREAWPLCQVTAAECDASDGNALRAALRAAPPIDLFCANAGNLIGGSCESASGLRPESEL